MLPVRPTGSGGNAPPVNPAQQGLGATASVPKVTDPNEAMRRAIVGGQRLGFGKSSKVLFKEVVAGYDAAIDAAASGLEAVVEEGAVANMAVSSLMASLADLESALKSLNSSCQSTMKASLSPEAQQCMEVKCSNEVEPGLYHVSVENLARCDTTMVRNSGQFPPSKTKPLNLVGNLELIVGQARYPIFVQSEMNLSDIQKEITALGHFKCSILQLTKESSVGAGDGRYALKIQNRTPGQPLDVSELGQELNIHASGLTKEELNGVILVDDCKAESSDNSYEVVEGMTIIAKACGGVFDVRVESQVDHVLLGSCLQELAQAWGQWLMCLESLTAPGPDPLNSEQRAGPLYKYRRELLGCRDQMSKLMLDPAPGIGISLVTLGFRGLNDPSAFNFDPRVFNRCLDSGSSESVYKCLQAISGFEQGGLQGKIEHCRLSVVPQVVQKMQKINMASMAKGSSELAKLQAKKEKQETKMAEVAAKTMKMRLNAQAMQDLMKSTQKN